MENQNQPETQSEVKTANKINYVFGDATKPSGSGFRIIPHVCNDINLFGSGFAEALNKVDIRPKTKYHAWYSDGATGVYESGPFSLGEIQVVPFGPSTDSIYVINMIAQHGVKGPGNSTPIRYESLSSCMLKVAEYASEKKAAILAPMFGSERAGGKWEKIEKMIIDEWTSKGLSVTIYRF